MNTKLLLLIAAPAIGYAAAKKSPSAFLWSMAGLFVPFPWSVPLTIMGVVSTWDDVKDTIAKAQAQAIQAAVEKAHPGLTTTSTFSGPTKTAGPIGAGGVGGRGRR